MKGREKRVNRGGGYGLEVPVTYYFSGPRNLIDWTKEKLKIRKKNEKMFEINDLKTLIICIFMSKTSFTLDVR